MLGYYFVAGETPNSFEKPTKKCNSGESELCNEKTCYSCNTIREQNADIVRGTILVSTNYWRFTRSYYNCCNSLL